MVDLLQGGQGVFGIALGRVWREVEGDLAVLPAVRAEDGLVAVPPGGVRVRGRPGQAAAAPHQLSWFYRPRPTIWAWLRVGSQVLMTPAGRVSA